MSDLTDFLLARIAEDEEDARAEQRRYLDAHGVAGFVDAAYAYSFMDPARVPAECEAKRRIVEECQFALVAGLPDRGAGRGTAHAILRALALPYAGHPGYDESWRP